MWLSRDKDKVRTSLQGLVDSYNLHEGKTRPKKDSDGWYEYGTPLCPEEFHKFVKNIRLRPGQCIEIREIRFILKKKGEEMKELEQEIELILTGWTKDTRDLDYWLNHKAITDIAALVRKRETYPVCSACHKPIVRWHLRCNCDCAGDENEERTDA